MGKDRKDVSSPAVTMCQMRALTHLLNYYNNRIGFLHKKCSLFVITKETLVRNFNNTEINHLRILNILVVSFQPQCAVGTN